MAAKNTLKYKRNRSPSLIQVVDKLINRGLDAIVTGKTKVTVSDLIRTYRLWQKLSPAAPAPSPPKWVDDHSPAG